VPNLGGAVLDPIALADLMGAVFIHEAMVPGVFDHRLVKQGLIAFELDEHVIAVDVKKVVAFSRLLFV
jgi:hypothetical protein